MSFSDDEDDWISVEGWSDTRTQAAVDAALVSLVQDSPRKALLHVCESVQWFTLKTLSKASAKLRENVNPIAVVASQKLDHATLDQLEEQSAHEDVIQDDCPEEELEQYSASATRMLYDIFNDRRAFPCRCQPTALRIVERHCCALQLDATWESPGDEERSYFSAVIALDENFEWRQLQFQIPRVISRVQFIQTNIGQVHEVYQPLTDFCEVVEDQQLHHYQPIRIEGNIPNHHLYELAPVFIEDFPDDNAPVPLLDAVGADLLSAKKKIHIAFTLAKSYWQYYESDLMREPWSLESIHLIPQRNHTSTMNHDTQVPFLMLNDANRTTDLSPESQAQDPISGRRHMHQHPYILNLCLLLVLLCTETGSLPKPPTKLDEIYFFCCARIKPKDSPWPLIPLNDHYRQVYRDIVMNCLPQDVRQPMGSSIEERRILLRDKVVRPLYRLLRGMQGLVVEELPPLEAALAGFQSYPSDDFEMDMVGGVPSPESRAWIDTTRNSRLHLHLANMFDKGETKRRPKVAIIDTGYDAKARWLDRALKMRLEHRDTNGQLSRHWKDCWAEKVEPIDELGHGTSMLYTLMRIAPFADVCVVRVSQDSNSLEHQSALTSQKLAEAIIWAAETQQADIISMSLGWEEEIPFEGRPVVSNAISRVLEKRDQKILFFAAASNYGSGRKEFFPAKHAQVISVRATNTLGRHEDFNAPLPADGGCVIGTLGNRVPTKEKSHIEITRTGTSVATAIAAGIAAHIIGYINTDGVDHAWDSMRTLDGFKKLLLHQSFSTEQEHRKRFLTIERLTGRNWQRDLEACLNSPPP